MQTDQRDGINKSVKRLEKKFYFWIEEYLFYPKTFFQKFLSILLLPLSALYCTVVVLKRVFSSAEKFPVPIISIGNLTLGGSGKTPFTIALAKRREDAAIVLRGYKRNSSGTVTVSINGKIKTDISSSGDEAMLFAKSLPKATVIVSEDRKKGISKAISLGAKIVFLDDGFSKAKIDKLDILLKPTDEPTNNFCLPSGPYREPKSYYKKADITAVEGRDFKRIVEIENPTDKMVLVTSISKPARLDGYLPEGVIKKIYFKDHHLFKKEEIRRIIEKYRPLSLLVTEKDLVKLQKFGFNLSVMKLQMEINPKTTEKINTFLDDFGKIR